MIRQAIPEAPSISLLPVPHRHDEIELLDNPSEFVSELPDNLRDLRRVNRLIGGRAHVIGAVEELLDGTQSASILDVATGSADIPAALLDWAKPRGKSLRILATDVSPEILMEARRLNKGREIELEQADARHLPYPDCSFDLVNCSLALHHLRPTDAVLVLREMWRVSRLGIVVTDLKRSALGYAVGWLAPRLTTHNRLSRHDAPLSILRAYTTDELRQLAREAQLDSVTIRRRAFFRQQLIARKQA